ncbi:hypothetical protein OSB04_022065 [Centaurea solstitialis]|uniref:Lipoxygenase n=1 Tax=Centaurea solstitialis TaxID=347529 RepID=A0AA38TDR9_9ASTR|nr:hypothetical protein OSB04_022065 [Centaurea solstitialis]
MGCGFRSSLRTRTRRVRGSKIRAVVSKEEGKRSMAAKISKAAVNGGMIDLKAMITIKKKMKEKMEINGRILIQLISEDIDPETKSGIFAQSSARGWLPRASTHPRVMEFTCNLTFRPTLALRELFWSQIYSGKSSTWSTLSSMGSTKVRSSSLPILGSIRNMLTPIAESSSKIRLTYRHKPRRAQRSSPRRSTKCRGNGKGERKPHDRIYDYAPYNDLGNPTSPKTWPDRVLGVPARPYPRRCRTGRPQTKSDPESETRIEKPHPVYVPRDETFEEIKQDTFSAGRLKALLHNLIPSIAATLSASDISFQCFSDIDKLYNDGFFLKDAQQRNFMIKLMNQVTAVGERLLKYDIPAIIKRDRFAWLRDDEFARQALAGVNPMNIKLLKELPILSKLDATIYGPEESAITKEVIAEELNGMSVEETYLKIYQPEIRISDNVAIREKRLFIIDYHDTLLPFIEEMNTLRGREAYASRTVLFYNQAGVLRPIVIELSLHQRLLCLQINGHDATAHWLWNLAKAHVCSNDAGIHQLVNHWLRTHACMEPYIIASHRQLSCLHPVFKLLHPHMRYTLEINALARQSLINGGGIIEASFSPGKFSMELSSAAYKNSWQFDLEALPADLIHRGMAVEDPMMPQGVKLVIEDYPYAADGLLIWSAIKELVESFVGHYYSEPNSITSDIELQMWWSEVRNKGHHDKRNESWWPQLDTKEDLLGVLTTIIWIASGQHAAINFGQYPFGGYVPNRPTLMRKLIAEEGEPEYEQFLMNPQFTFLSSLPTQLQATKVMAVQDTLSTHSADEEYLGQVHHFQNQWLHDGEVSKFFERFRDRLEEIETVINSRNKDTRLKNRTGAGIPPYELLLPTSGPGVTGRGVPNSISI